jgi:hypothetical protein
MKNLLKLSVSMILAVLFNSCRNSTDRSMEANTARTRAEIERILKVQDDAYALHNEEGYKILQSTCVDSMLYVGTDGGIMKSSYDYSHDLADGWIDRPHDNIFWFYENTVIVTSVYKSYYRHNGDSIFINSRMTKVFVRENNQWRMAHVGTAPLPVSYFKDPGYKVSSAILLNEYTGVYTVDPSTADTISVMNGKLFVQNRHEKERTELLPLNDSTFMLKGYPGKIVFMKNGAGRVTHYYFEGTDGQQFRDPKVK